MKDTSGPAFPYSGVHKGSDMNYIIDNHGMTLRDYFAAKFMQGICANPDKLYDDEPLAKEAYAMADAMLKAREE